MPPHPSSLPTVDDLTAAHGDGRPSSDIALLAATALGFAYNRAESDETLTRRLVALADLKADPLSRAQAAVLTFEVGSARARARAAALLRNAAQSIVDLCDVGRHTDPVNPFGALPATAVDGRR